MTEQLWLEQARQGNEAAFGELVALYQAPIYNLCYRMLSDGGEAEDAAQEAFLRAYAQLRRYDPTRSFKTWLFSIAHHHCIDRIRKRRLLWLSLDEPLPPHPALHDPALGPEDASARREQTEIIQHLLAELPPEDRGVIVMRYWNDLSYEEIAEATRNTVSSVKSRLHRARGALAQKLTALPVAARPALGRFLAEA